MEMEELGERSELGLSVIQREQERERRRMRDRQRRQSMTLEQRERHLARRRRNYQLRRLRAVETASTRLVDNDNTSGGLEMVLSHDNQTPQIGFQDNGFDSINGFVQGKEKLNAQCLESMSMETLAQNSVNVPKKLRLSQVRCLARSLNRFGGGVGGSFRNVTDVMPKNVADTNLQLGDNDSGRLPGGLRLNRIKRLARALNTTNSETNGQSVEHNLPQEGSQVLSSGKPNFGEPTISRG